MDNAVEAPQRFGKYELVDEIGHGGMAVVHRGRYEGIGGFSKPVVIKRILPELASEGPFVKMFVEEARLSALLDHPNIVQIHDFGIIDGSYYLAMEYIEGIPLHRFMRYFSRRKTLPPEAAAYIVQQVCIGLQYAHQLSRDGRPLGIVHRDVSPANIMLSVHGTVKLLDFGIAKAVQAIDREETRTGTLKGKWSYMSPEQVVGQSITARSDIFATGIVLWELLTGRRLFKARTDFLTLSNVAQARVTPASTLCPGVPPAYDDICRRALARRPKDRYATAEEMADDLDAQLSRHPFSSTLLATMVAEVQLEADTGRDEEPSGPDSASTPSDSGSTSDSVSVGQVKTHASRRQFTTAGPDLFQRNPWLLPVALGAATAAIFALVLVYLLVPAPDRRAKQSIRPKTAHATIRVQTFSSPEGASVTVSGEGNSRGRTPFTLELTRSSTPVKLIASLPGHRSQELLLTPNEDRDLYIRLQPESTRRLDTKRGPTRSRRSAATVKIRSAPRESTRPAKKETRKPTAKPLPVKSTPTKPASAKPVQTKTAAKPSAKKEKKDVDDSAAPKKQPLPNLKSGDLADPYR